MVDGWVEGGRDAQLYIYNTVYTQIGEHPRYYQPPNHSAVRSGSFEFDGDRCVGQLCECVCVRERARTCRATCCIPLAQ